MNSNMWEHDATRANLEILRKRGHVIVDPDDGFLACGTYGPGRLAENDQIVAAVERAFAPKDFAAETMLVTAGATQEPLDPVRYLTNRSSGKMGYAIAQAALDRGARVILVSAPVNLRPPMGADVISVRTAQQMRDAVMAHLQPATVIVKCAAVADFRPVAVSGQKIKKGASVRSIEFEPTIDILAELGQVRGDRLLIGFAAETENLESYARAKLNAKNCDMIVANQVGNSGTGFDADSNEVFLTLRSGEYIAVPKAEKRVIADRILDRILKLRLDDARRTSTTA
jgi:phosphopantothenoylcysteine decarboxylase / phosphopantothenate---cysteine ligase